MNFFTKETHRRRDQIYGCWGGQGWQNRGKRQGVWDGHVHTAIFKMDSQQGSTVEHRELCSMSCGGLDGEWSLGQNGYMCMYG